MQAIRQTVLGGPDVLRLTELPQPEPGPTEVLVRVNAAGVNPLDWKTRARGVFLGHPPFTVGADPAGVVVAVGSGVTRFAVGDRVFGMPRFPQAAATYAEFITAPSRQLARTPESLRDVEAAALPMAGLTAWQALVDTANLGRGDRVLIHAAAGGIGHLAVQIAKDRGAYVIGTARAAKHAFSPNRASTRRSTTPARRSPKWSGTSMSSSILRAARTPSARFPFCVTEACWSGSRPAPTWRRRLPAGGCA
jgi:NADPH:quinone reductase-like Zn-dependent oxidoreductase